MSLYRQYSDDDKAVALAVLEVNKGDYSRTARQCNVPRQHLQRWVRGEGVNDAVQEIVQGKRGDLANRFEARAHEFLDAVTPEKIAEAGLRDLMTSAAIATDKMRLLREQSTVNVAHTLTNEDRIARLQELMQIMADRKALAEQEADATIDAEFESEEVAE